MRSTWFSMFCHGASLPRLPSWVESGHFVSLRLAAPHFGGVDSGYLLGAGYLKSIYKAQGANIFGLLLF